MLTELDWTAGLNRTGPDRMADGEGSEGASGRGGEVVWLGVDSAGLGAGMVVR